jgi:putative SOS response-associated peptidase YedK
MCDRFVLHASGKAVEDFFNISSKSRDIFSLNYNITPASRHPVALYELGERLLRPARWGLIPPDAEEERTGNESHVVPAEDVLEDEWLAECVHHRRCLAPANGFYKWKSSERTKNPFYIRLLSGRLMAFAGIYGLWKSPSGRTVYSFAILTTKANPLIEPVDDRMPALLQRKHFTNWLSDEELTTTMYEELLLKPYKLTEMAVNRVSDEVNDSANNYPELIRPIPK